MTAAEKDEAPTAVSPPEGHGATPGPVSGPVRVSMSAGSGDHAVTGGASAFTIVALRDEEAARTSAFGRAIALLAVLGLGVHLTVYRGGVLILRHAMTASLVTMAVTGVGVWRVARRAERYTPRVAVFFGAMCLVTSFFIELYLGVFSPFPCIVALGLSTFGLVDEARVVIPLCIGASLLYYVVAVLIAFGVIQDPGLFAPANPSTAERMGMATMVLAVYAAALWHARVSRAATRDAIERSNQAALAARQHAALLVEAHQHLDAALKANEGKGGRWTGASVGSFRIGALVGRGAMGEVYAAEHVHTGRAAAIKMLHARVLADTSMVKRFIREAEIASRLRVPHVVELLETGDGPDGAPYLAMELLAGHDLAWHLRKRRRLPLAEVVTMIDHVAAGLSAAHEAGIVHRDLKPQNLLLHERPAPATPVWKILDFGVSKLRDGGGTLTEGGAIVGTPGYIAPEQVRSGTADARSDVFALGAVTYRALTGQPAFSGNEVQTLFDVVYKQPPAPSDLARGLPVDVDRAIALALAKKPDERIARPLDFADALRAASRGELPPRLVARADAVIAACPWGSTLGAR
ncbi:MAG TPA: serine/threonine-protein kinase [Polyangiaceae bacterium]